MQLVIRLLIPRGSRLLELDDVQAIVGPYSPVSLTYPWRHPIPEVDALQRRLEAMVGTQLVADRQQLFARVWDEAHAAAGQPSARANRAAAPGARGDSVPRTSLGTVERSRPSEQVALV